MTVKVLRLGHRYIRDDRTTTHLFLAARALGADGAIYSGRRDREIEESLRKISKTWGGDFRLDYTPNWRTTLDDHKARGWKTVHLTMYGLPLKEAIEEIRSSPTDKMVIVGGAKVPKETYQLADWNVAVTNQPHSEVSALGVFLHELFDGKELSRPFPGARLEIIPQPKGKRIQGKTYSTAPARSL